MDKRVFFITGIDTDIGKTICTGLFAKWLREQDKSVITQKPVQTGCVGISEDIKAHRTLMGVDLFEEDLSGITCSYIYKKPCSPHLASEIEQREIHCSKISEATKTLLSRYDNVLIEGAGGLCAPINRKVNSIDYVQQQGYPIILVSSSRLGSISHTLSLVELCKLRQIEIAGVIYNRFNEEDEVIGDDSRTMIIEGLRRFGFKSGVVDIFNSQENYTYDFSKFLI